LVGVCGAAAGATIGVAVGGTVVAVGDATLAIVTVGVSVTATVGASVGATVAVDAEAGGIPALSVLDAGVPPQPTKISVPNATTAKRNRLHVASGTGSSSHGTFAGYRASIGFGGD